MVEKNKKQNQSRAHRKSNRKPNGSTAAHRVKEAVKQCDCALERFFHHAAQIGEAPGSFNAMQEAAKFERFLRDGLAANPWYQIPAHVIELAEKVLSHPSPRSYFMSLRVQYHPTTTV